MGAPKTRGEFMNLRKLNDKVLLESTKRLSAEERKITAEILHHLQEIEFRRLHLELGYSSLFEYAVKELGYSEDSAYRRINAMRLIKNLPEVEGKIKDGSISLTKAAKIQSFIRNQEKIKNQKGMDSSRERNCYPLQLQTKQEKLNWIDTLEKKSIAEVEREILKLSPEAIPQEKVRQITEDKVELKLIIDDDLKMQLDQLKNLLSHKNPNMSYQELIKYLTKIGLQKLDPSKKAQSKNSRLKEQLKKSQLKKSELNSIHSGNLDQQRNVSGQPRKAASKNSRYIPSAVRHEVYMRDKGSCAYTDPKTKRKCESRHLLQYDHKYPLSLGGEMDSKNLRLLCFQHHKYVTENVKNHGI